MMLSGSPRTLVHRALAAPFVASSEGASMHLQFVGCGDAFGSGGRFNTCFHLVGREINALIDCGATSLVSMNKHAINRKDINVIFFSLSPPTNIAGLFFFSFNR